MRRIAIVLCLIFVLASVNANHLHDKGGQRNADQPLTGGQGNANQTFRGGQQRDILPGGDTCIADPSLLTKYANNNMILGVGLYKRILQSGNQWNIVFSPASIGIGLALLELASGGSTLFEIHDQLCPDVPVQRERLIGAIRASIESIRGKENLAERRQFEIFAANALYVDESVDIKDDYKTTSMDCLKSLVTNVNFQNDTEAARVRINDWVSRRTNQKLNETKEIFPSGTLRDDARVVLVNAFGLYAEYLNPFTRGRIENGRFFLNNNQNGIQLPVMTMENQFRHTERPNMHVLGIDYKNRELTLFIFAPKAAGGLQRMERELGADDLNRLMDEATDKRLEISIPKFEVDHRLPLRQYLQQMGVNEVFNGRADLSRLSDDNDLFVSEAVHQACFKVNERGTEEGMMENVNPIPPTIMGRQNRVTVDSPFLFIVRHNPSSIPLLMGRVTNPIMKADQLQDLFMGTSPTPIFGFSPTPTPPFFFPTEPGQFRGRRIR